MQLARRDRPPDISPRLRTRVAIERKLTMFRLLRLILVLAIGISIGIWFERLLMKNECAAGEGEWTGTICVNSELLQ